MSFRHVQRSRCMGCGLCYSACRFEAIKMERDVLSFVPQLIEENCTDCGVCVRVCPGVNVLDYPEMFGQIKSCMICTAKDEHVRRLASSGGACRSILAALLEQGLVDRVIVTRSTDDPYRPETIITDEISILMSDRLNSIYSPTSPLAALKDLSGQLKYAFVGLPCHIAGLELFPEIKDKIFVTIGIFCSQTPSFQFVDRLIHDLSEHGEVARIQYRGDGWPGKTVAFDRDRRVAEQNYMDMWLRYNHEHTFELSRCKECTYYSSEFADISIGDPWHLAGQDPEGSSLVLVRSERGVFVVEASQSWLNMKPVGNIEEALQFHEYNSQSKRQNKSRMIRN